MPAVPKKPLDHQDLFQSQQPHFRSQVAKGTSELCIEGKRYLNQKPPDYVKARDCFERALAIDIGTDITEIDSLPQTPAVARDITYLALVDKAQKDFKQADSQFQWAADIFLKQGALQDPPAYDLALSSVYYHLAMLYIEQSLKNNPDFIEVDESKLLTETSSILDSAKKINDSSQKLFSPKQPSAGDIAKKTLLDKAEDLLQEALDIHQQFQILDKNTKSYPATLRDTATPRMMPIKEKLEWVKKIQLSEKTRRLNEEGLTYLNPKTYDPVKAINLLTTALTMDYSAAGLETLKGQEQRFHLWNEIRDHLNLGFANSNASQCEEFLKSRSYYEEAKKHYTAGIMLLERALPVSHAGLLVAMNNLGVLQTRTDTQESIQQAVTLFESAEQHLDAFSQNNPEQSKVLRTKILYNLKTALERQKVLLGNKKLEETRQKIQRVSAKLSQAGGIAGPKEGRYFMLPMLEDW